MPADSATLPRVQRARFRQLRIGALLLLLFAVASYALADIRSRRRRNEWTEPVTVALVLLEEEPVDPATVERMRGRLSALEEQLASEQHRYLNTSVPAFHFELFGPARVSRIPPHLETDGAWDLVRYTWEMRRYASAVDEGLGVATSRFDSRVYATIRPAVSAQPAHVEGQSEEGGRIAQVRVELDEAMVDLALIVVTHELFHTLGAVDKYDATGRSLIPDGLADPDRVPTYPQAQVEVMARDRPVSASKEVVPATLAELGVGPRTAREIGWTH